MSRADLGMESIFHAVFAGFAGGPPRQDRRRL